MARALRRSALAAFAGARAGSSGLATRAAQRKEEARAASISARATYRRALRAVRDCPDMMQRVTMGTYARQSFRDNRCADPRRAASLLEDAVEQIEWSEYLHGIRRGAEDEAAAAKAAAKDAAAAASPPSEPAPVAAPTPPVAPVASAAAPFGGELGTYCETHGLPIDLGGWDRDELAGVSADDLAALGLEPVAALRLSAKIRGLLLRDAEAPVDGAAALVDGVGAVATMEVGDDAAAVDGGAGAAAPVDGVGAVGL